jgi:hypothetical protein
MTRRAGDPEHESTDEDRPWFLDPEMRRERVRPGENRWRRLGALGTAVGLRVAWVRYRPDDSRAMPDSLTQLLIALVTYAIVDGSLRHYLRRGVAFWASAKVRRMLAPQI